ncbi:hypothetical protein BUE80_DR009028 [Diplocarpon rosae]|nr:hypothetical protein BUE80_DR009028 [Diplocarpon rosae]
MATQMAPTRQPFAPLTSSRLQNLTSLKNRQNAISSPSKRKATTFDSDNDAENIDPVAFLSAKRSKQPDGTYAASSKDALCKPTNYILTRAPPSSGLSSAPAVASSAPTPLTEHLPIPVLHTDAARESWFFEIHEDTEEELATNLMEHGACTLDISSDEESAARERESCGKENVPPGDDVSQTRLAHSTPTASGHLKEASETKRSRKGRAQDENSIELDRAPLGDLAAEDFYAEGCDRSAVVIVAEDEQAQEQDQEEAAHELGVASTFDFTAEAVGKGKGVEVNVCVEALMAKTGEAPQAKLLEPVDKVEEGWSVWESGSAKGDD